MKKNEQQNYKMITNSAVPDLISEEKQLNTKKTYRNRRAEKERMTYAIFVKL